MTIIRISDCTLRDVRHSPGIYISPEEAVRIAVKLDSLCVDEIEAAILNGTPSEAEVLRAIADRGIKAMLSGVYFCTTTQTIEDSIQFALDNGCRSICISIPTSDIFIQTKLKRSFRATCRLMEKAVSYAAGKGLAVTFSGEDAARANIDSLIEYVRIGAEAGARRFRFAESVACLAPNQMYDRIARLVESSTIDIEVHCHSSYGLAEANTIAAIEAGVRWVSVTVEGVGERGGNTALGPILLYLYKFKEQKRFEPRGLKELSTLFEEVTKLPLHRFTSITGDSAFEYEIGQQYKSHTIYEDYPPELVGNQRKLIFGMKHDRIALQLILGKVDVPLTVKQKIEDISKHRRVGLSEKELIDIIRDQNYE